MTITWPRHADGTSKEYRDWTLADMAAMKIAESGIANAEIIMTVADQEYTRGRISLASHGFAMCAGNPVMLCQAIREAARG